MKCLCALALVSFVLAGPPSLRSTVNNAILTTDGSASGQRQHNIFTGHDLFNKKGERVNPDDVLAGKEVAIYYAGEFCPVCRDFTPKLRDFFAERNRGGRPLEVIFLSADETEEAALKHFQHSHGDWLRMSFTDILAPELKRKYRIASNVPHEMRSLSEEQKATRRSGTPAVVLIKPDGTEVRFFNTEQLGRAALDPWESMSNYAWPPRFDL